MRSTFALFALTLVMALAACQTGYIGNEDSPYYTVPLGSRLVLNRALTIPPEQVGVAVQEGAIVPYWDVHTYEPHCKFEVRRRLPAAQTVAPDEFLVTRVSRGWEHSVDAGTRRYADASMAHRVKDGGNGHDNGPSIQAFATRMYLGSDRQPDAFRLSCGRLGYPRQDQHVTIDEIRRALGEIMTLRVAEPRK